MSPGARQITSGRLAFCCLYPFLGSDAGRATNSNITMKYRLVCVRGIVMSLSSDISPSIKRLIADPS